jgi:predicted permease
MKLRLRAWMRPTEFADEISLHLEQLEGELRGSGMSPEEARQAARRQFGNVTSFREKSHDLMHPVWLEDLSRDLQFAWRSLRRNPSVAVAAILSMGLAIGANTTVFSLIQEVLFTLPTTRAASDLVTVRMGGSSHVSLPNLRDLDAQGVFETVAGFDVETEVNWRSGDQVRRIPVMLVSENFFNLMETRPLLGRTFLKDEAKAERNPHLVVITHRLWAGTFDRDPQITSRHLIINGRAYSITGVLPENFRPPTFLNVMPDLYVPASAELKPTIFNRQIATTFMLVARRKPGQSVTRAIAATRVAAQRLASAYPRENENLANHIRVKPVAGFAEFQDPDAAPLLVFSGVLLLAGFVILWIACVNVAGVLIARAASRRREIATRLAIGASRPRLVRQLLAESLLLAGLGTLAGLCLHAYLARLLNNLTLPLPLPIVFHIQTDVPLLIYAIALTCVAAVVAGLLPALQATRPGLTSGLKLEEPQYGHRRFTLRNLLVAGQVAVTVVLLSVGMLFARSLVRINSITPGFDLRRTVWARTSVVNDRYTNEQLRMFASQAIEAARSVPGVRSAAITTAVPFNNFMRSRTLVRTGSDSKEVQFYESRVSPAYFDAMSIPMLAGRDFQASDGKGAQPVGIMNLAMARHLFPEGNAVGQQLWFGGEQDRRGMLVVGIAANTRHMTMSEDQVMALYTPLWQAGRLRYELNVMVRAEGEPEAALAGVKRAISGLDPTAAVEVSPLRNKLAFAYLPSQIGATLVGSLGLLGLACLSQLAGLAAGKSFRISGGV